MRAFHVGGTAAEVRSRRHRRDRPEVAATGAGSCLVITDSGVRGTGVPDRIHAQLVAAGIKAEVFDRVAIEPPTKASTRPWHGPASRTGTASSRWVAGRPSTPPKR